MLAPHISVVNLGCRVNRVESDRITADLMRLGFAMVEPQDAELIVVVISVIFVAGIFLGSVGGGFRGGNIGVDHIAEYRVGDDRISGRGRSRGGAGGGE